MSRTGLLAAIEVALLVGAAAPSAGQPARLGGELQVNTYTTNDQQFADVAVGPDGRFVVVWKSPGSDFFDNDVSIQARRYDADGTPLTQDFEVNTYRTGFQNHPRVDVGPTGDFVVVWNSDGSDDFTNRDTSGSSVQARRYASTGSPIGIDFQVNSYTTGNQLYPAVVVGLAGDFVVVWQSNGSPEDDQDGTSVLARRFDGTGAPVGNDFQINTLTVGSQESANIAMDSAGGFVVVWQSDTSGEGDPLLSVQARRYALDGSPLGDQFQVNTSTAGYQYHAEVASGQGGEFVVVWSSDVAPGDSYYGIQAQRFAADGSPVGGELQVNAYTTGVQQDPDVDIGADGTFVVSWSSDDSGGTDSFFSVQARHFAADGAPLSPDFQVNTYTTSTQVGPAVHFSSAGVFVVVWDSIGSSGSGAPVLDSDGWSVQAQLFDSTGIFFDGFESGSLAAWTSATL